MATHAIALDLPRTQPSRARLYFNEVRFEILRLSRNRSYIFSTFGFPVALLPSLWRHQQERGLSGPHHCTLPVGRVCLLWRHGLVVICHRRHIGNRALERMARAKANQPYAGDRVPAGEVVCEHHFCRMHYLHPHRSWNRNGWCTSHRGRSASTGGGNCRRGCSLCQPGTVARPRGSGECGPGRHQPGLSAALVLRGIVDAHRGTAPLAAVRGSLPALVLVFAPCLTLAWLQQQ